MLTFASHTIYFNAYIWHLQWDSCNAGCSPWPFHCHQNGESYDICLSGNLTQGWDIVQAESWIWRQQSSRSATWECEGVFGKHYWTSRWIYSWMLDSFQLDDLAADTNGGADAKLFKEHDLQGLLCESSIYPVICCSLIQYFNSNTHTLSTNYHHDYSMVDE